MAKKAKNTQKFGKNVKSKKKYFPKKKKKFFFFFFFFFFTGPNPKQDEVLKVDVKKPHKFIYPRLNFFGSGSSNVVADSSAGWFTFIYNFYVIVYTY